MNHKEKSCWFCICLKNVGAPEILSIVNTLHKFGYMDDDWWAENDCPELEWWLEKN